MSDKLRRHYLTWRKGRATPDVTPSSSQRKENTAGGEVIARRAATQQEEKTIRKGRWVTTRPMGQPNKRSSVRPALARKQRNPKTDDGTKSRPGGKPR